ncbi:hypothetical protein DMUE_0093 [Dictyocoela muelleri]|nr:hypothetical protein DMUE_0093 [Dictyocoela muelleri]
MIVEILDIIYQYNHTVLSVNKKTPYELFRDFNFNCIHSNTIASETEIIENVRKYTTKFYTKNEDDIVFREGDNVLLAKDFDSNVKTSKNPLDCNFFETIFVVIKSENG